MSSQTARRLLLGLAMITASTILLFGALALSSNPLDWRLVPKTSGFLLGLCFASVIYWSPVCLAMFLYTATEHDGNWRKQLRYTAVLGFCSFINFALWCSLYSLAVPA